MIYRNTQIRKTMGTPIKSKTILRERISGLLRRTERHVIENILTE